MRCPRCGQEGFQPNGVCARCEFAGAPLRIEELAHVAYLLGEVESWQDVSPASRDQLRARYLKRREELELALGLRPALDAAAIQDLHWNLYRLAALEAEVSAWEQRGWMRPSEAARLRQQMAARAAAHRQQLAAAAPGEAAPAFGTAEDRLAVLDYVQEVMARARAAGYFAGRAAQQAARTDLQARRRRVEVEAGLRTPEPLAAVAPEPAPARPPRPPREPREPRAPLTWDRVWQTLLSEKTLNYLLFLGASLLVISAATYVFYNWEKLPAGVQLASIVLLTVSLYAGGWFLRVRLNARASGIAVTASGSAMVPLDFYAVFVAGGAVPAVYWPWVWLAASAVCLPVYTYTALRLWAPFFGYLVAAAAGSLACAVLRVLGLPDAWFLAGLVAVALVLLLVAYGQAPAREEGALLAAPLRLSALLGTAVLLPLGLAWWLAPDGARGLALGAAGPAFDASLAGAWLLGTVVFAWAAVRERSALLGRAAATALPLAVSLLLRLPFERWQVEAPWHALGWAGLVPLYLAAARRAGARAGDDAVRAAHSRTAAAWALALAGLAAAWSVLDLWAAAASHAVLALAAAQAVYLWRRPRLLPLASLLALSSTTFAMAAGHLEPAELSLGWALLAVVHVLLALRLRAAVGHAARLLAAALLLALLALLPPALVRHEPLLTYALGHWLVLVLWLLRLDARGENHGLALLLGRFGPFRWSVLHGALALPLPLFAALVYTRFAPPDGGLLALRAQAQVGLVLAGLAWLCFAIGQLRLLTSPSAVPGPSPAAESVFRPSSIVPPTAHWSVPWYAAAYLCSLAGPLVALLARDQAALGVTLLLGAGLYFASAWAFRADQWLMPGGLALPAGLLVLLDLWAIPWPRQSVALALVAAGYLLAGAWLERRRGVPRDFMASLDAVAHLLAAVAVGWGLAPAFSPPWPDSARVWAAGGQAVLAVAYGLFAWWRGRERWAHVAAWLGVLAGGLVAVAYSQGRGSSAFKAALLAVAYVLAERALAGAWLRRRWPVAGRAWPLYRRALLVAGWTVSGGTVALALVRNLVLLGGGRVQVMWAVAGLLAIVALYAFGAWSYRRRLLAWLAALLVVAPWTLLTAWGWFVWPAPPPLPHHALAWIILAGVQLALGLYLTQRREALHRASPPAQTDASDEVSGTRYLIPDTQSPDHGFALRAVAHALLPISLLTGAADAAISAWTWGLALVLYLASAVADGRRGLPGWQAARFVYPAAGVLPVWALYLLNRAWPAAPYETYGLLLLALALPLLVAGRLLVAARLPAHTLPLYLAAYGTAIAGTLLVAHREPLLAAALAFDAALCVLSAWLFREPAWAYAAAALAPAALLVALAQGQVPPERRGWWLVGLGAVYLALAWLLRRAGRRAYAVPPLVGTFAVVSLGLPPSSLDETGAFWGYLAAALIYGLAAAWLRQPLLLLATAGLLAVPYGVSLVWLGLEPGGYGLAVFPGVAAALAVAHLLDWRLGRLEPVPPSGQTVLDRLKSRLAGLLDWWAAPFYAWAYLGALVAAGLSWADPARLSVALALAAAAFLHATWRFSSRAALLLAGALAQAAVVAVIDAAGWLRYPAWAALAFLPATVVTALLALGVELGPDRGARSAGSTGRGAWAARLRGWAGPLYLLLAVDLGVGQALALLGREPGAIVTGVHALLLALLASAWLAPALAWAAAGLGVVSLGQGLAWAGAVATDYPVAAALLALAYGLAGYGPAAALPASRRARLWRGVLEWTALGLSLVALLATAGIGLDVSRLVVRAFLGRAFVLADFMPELRMAIWVLSLSGLLYLATAAVRRLYALGYGAVALLLGAWGLWWRFLVDMPGFQWYALPAGLYLLAIGWLEWRQGHRVLARWIDRAGMVTWLGTAWWQSLPGVMANGWPFALLMGAESLLLLWWGSARRHKRFLYVGTVGVLLDAVTQSIEPLLSTNRWIVFGVAGVLIVGLAILVERRLQRIRELSAEVRQRLEAWE